MDTLKQNAFSQNQRTEAMLALSLLWGEGWQEAVLHHLWLTFKSSDSRNIPILIHYTCLHVDLIRGLCVLLVRKSPYTKACSSPPSQFSSSFLGILFTAIFSSISLSNLWRINEQCYLCFAFPRTNWFEKYKEPAFPKSAFLCQRFQHPKWEHYKSLFQSSWQLSVRLGHGNGHWRQGRSSDSRTTHDEEEGLCPTEWKSLEKGGYLQPGL